MTARFATMCIDGPVLITGGAGFIGSNLAARLLDEGAKVIVYDNLSRDGAAQNLQWLSRIGGDRLSACLADTRDAESLRNAVGRAGCIFHFAARASVTSSLADPLGDFEVNLRGTLNLLEAIRQCPLPPPLVSASTSKVYGELSDIAVSAHASRYQPDDPEVRLFGLSESRPLQFCSPCGCSKGAADQYVLDYARHYGIPAVVLRLGSIYGPRQHGDEGQGWITHFLWRAMQGQAITVYGDGLQVRDVLHVDDLVDALLLCGAGRNEMRGRAFNIGGGTANTVSLVELLDMIHALRGRAPRVLRADWRAADPRYFVADTRRFGFATGWRPRIDPATGVGDLFRWLQQEIGAGLLSGENAAQTSPSMEGLHA